MTQGLSESTILGPWRAPEWRWHPEGTEPWCRTWGVRAHFLHPVSFLHPETQGPATPHSFTSLSACVSQVLGHWRQCWPYKVQSQIPGLFDICNSQICLWKEWKNNNKFIFQAVYYEFQCFPVSSHEASFRLVVKPCLVYVGDITGWQKAVDLTS